MHTIKLKFLAFFCIIEFSLIACSAGKGVEAVNVREIISHPARYVGKEVSLTGCYLSGRHGTSVYDCQDRSELLRVSIPPGVAESAKGKLLIERGYSQWPPGAEVVIPLNVRGVLSRIDDGGIDFEIQEVLSVGDATRP